jgi:hypothetical protein
MALSVPDDNMELATSPFQRLEDLDIDFDDFEDQEIHEMPQDPVDDMAHENEDVVEDMVEDEQTNQDDNMLAEDPDVNFNVEHQDSDMDQTEQAYDQNIEPSLDNREDADLLFEEDEEVELQAGHPEHAPITADLNEQQLPHGTTDKQGDLTEQDNPDVDSASIVHELNDLAGEAATSSADAVETSSAIVARDASEPRAGLPQEFAGPAQDFESGGNIPEPLRNEHVEGDAELDALEIPSNDHVKEARAVEDSAIQSALQAIRIEWTESLYPLFVSEGETLPCFLYDTAIAYEPLDKLLADCRTAIQSEMGENDELILDVDALGLHISEDSKYASQLTLAQIVEVYLYLNRNETQDDVLPLPCRLTSRVCLETQYNYLMREATQHGRTFSSIVEENVPSPPEAEEDDGGSQAHALADTDAIASAATKVISDIEALGGELDTAPLNPPEAVAVDVSAQVSGQDSPKAIVSEAVTTVTGTLTELTEEQASNESLLENPVESIVQQDASGRDGGTIEEAEIAILDDEPEDSLLEHGESLNEYATDVQPVDDNPAQVDAYDFNDDTADDYANPVPDETEIAPGEPHATATEPVAEATGDDLEASLDEELYGVYDDDDNSSHTVEHEGPFDQLNATTSGKAANDAANNDSGLGANADSATDHGEGYDDFNEEILTADVGAFDPASTATNGHDVDRLAALPATPNKVSPSKRKIEVDDDDLLDFGNETPERKRRRPS